MDIFSFRDSAISITLHFYYIFYYISTFSSIIIIIIVIIIVTIRAIFGVSSGLRILHAFQTNVGNSF